MPPPADRPHTAADDVNLVLQAIACPAFRYSHLTFGGHGLRAITTPTPQHRSTAGTQPARHDDPGSRP